MGGQKPGNGMHTFFRMSSALFLPAANSPISGNMKRLSFPNEGDEAWKQFRVIIFPHILAMQIRMENSDAG